jgi:DNA repair protein RAD7
MDTLADSLATSLRELYINDCQSIQPMLILPALKKLEHLEVLSLSGIQTINDNFLRGFIVARGHNIKELVLTDCV